MKKLIIILLFCTSLFQYCTKDNFLNTIENENIQQNVMTVKESEPERSVYYKISDSGQSDIRIRFDDGDYTNTPYPISMDVKNNIYNNDDIVIDNISNIIWTKCTALENNVMDTDDQCAGGAHGEYTWAEASSLCKNLQYGGYHDWRIPTITELFSIVNFDYTAPAIDPSIFPNTEGYPEGSLENPGKDGIYWASTLYNESDIALKWCINFNSVFGSSEWASLKFVNICTTNKKVYVRCCRRESKD